MLTAVENSETVAYMSPVQSRRVVFHEAAHAVVLVHFGFTLHETYLSKHDVSS